MRCACPAGAALGQCTLSGNTAFILAAAAGSIACLRMLHERRAEVDGVNALGESALFRAASEGRADAIELLLSWSAGVELQTNRGLSPLYVAGARRLQLKTVPAHCCPAFHCAHHVFTTVSTVS